MRFVRSAVSIALAVGLSCLIGCGHHKRSDPVVHSTPLPGPDSAPAFAAPVAVAAATQPNKTYQNTAGGISICYPATWISVPAKTSVLDVECPTKTITHTSLCLDIPKLPWHVPGMIPIGLVASDYASDVRKNLIPDAVVQENIAVTIPDANARRVTSVGHAAGRPAVDVGLIIIHSDHIFILSVDSDDAGQSDARKALDSAAASLKWTK